MNEKLWDIFTIEEFGAFADRPSCIKLLMMLCMNDAEGASGSWEIKNMLRNRKVELSAATAGRYLKELDDEGYTKKLSNKGRVLTDLGDEYLLKCSDTITANMLHKNMLHAVGGKEYQDLKDLYAVRIGVESKAVKDCCKMATDDEIEKIGKYASQYVELVEAGSSIVDVSLDFHVLIAKATHNEFMEKVLTMLIYEQKRIENSLEYLATREAGQLYSEQHIKIYKAIRQRNAKQAEKLMNEHFATIIKTFDS